MSGLTIERVEAVAEAFIEFAAAMAAARSAREHYSTARARAVAAARLIVPDVGQGEGALVQEAQELVMARLREMSANGG